MNLPQWFRRDAPRGYRRAWIEAKLWPDRLRRRLEAGVASRWLRATHDYDKITGEEVICSWIGATDYGPWFETRMPGRLAMERTETGWIVRSGLRPVLSRPDDEWGDIDIRARIELDDWTVSAEQLP